MRQVELVPGIFSSALGFGCAPVLGSVDAATARCAIHTALESGITHFDLARSYGFGQAEAFVGREIGSERGRLVLVTKFGICATWAAALLRPFKPLVRSLRRKARSSLENRAVAGVTPMTNGRLGNWLHRRLPMNAAAMRISLEESLRALRTDRVEILLLHEPEEISRGSELAACAEALKQEGKIRAWGLASAYDKPPSHELEERLDIWQTSVPSGPADFRSMQERQGNKPCILFSPLRGVPSVERGARLSQVWRSFPRAVVLCSMYDPAHIRSNAALAV